MTPCRVNTPGASPEHPGSPPIHEDAEGQTPSNELRIDKQCRKVFVGGIPQSIDSNGFYRMFNKIAKVKKAWLQMFQTDKENQEPSDATSKRHRGFGFVVFSEARSVDNLLGDEFSTFIEFGDDLTLEVKRAISKTNVSGATPESSQEKTERLSSISLAAALCGKHNTNPEHRRISLADTLGNQPCAASLHWQCSESTLGLPCLPPFPFAELSSQAVVTSAREPHDLPDFLLEGYPGQKPQSKEELALVLQRAMPDAYED
jgi:hypothetical protein